jgi:lipopolysaccharide transport system permease protein
VIKKIYYARYFWLYLAKSDIRFKYRRSKLGSIWAMIQPLGITLIMATVFSIAFDQPLGDYAVYILSGLIGWNLLNASIISGGQCLISASQYIRQFNHPKIIYALKSSLVFIFNFFMEFLGFFIWILITKPANLLYGLISFPLTLLLLFAIAWEIIIIVSYINAKYYDYPQLMALIMQAIYYISPVFFKEELFRSNEIMYMVYRYNPITHMLNLVREPFLYGKFPEGFTYLYLLIWILVLGVFAYCSYKKNEKTIIFYL